MTTRRPSRFAAGLLLAFFVQQSPTRAQDAPQILDSKDGKIRVVPVATDLFHPWSLAFADARTLLVTERNGRLRVISRRRAAARSRMDFANASRRE
jgi:glucose/arabinose dehydrogenase